MFSLPLGIFLVIAAFVVKSHVSYTTLIFGIIALLFGLLLEIRFERFAWKKLKSYLKNRQEISDLENQIKKEKLQKELSELKQQNSH